MTWITFLFATVLAVLVMKKTYKGHSPEPPTLVVLGFRVYDMNYISLCQLTHTHTLYIVCTGKKIIKIQSKCSFTYFNIFKILIMLRNIFLTPNFQYLFFIPFISLFIIKTLFRFLFHLISINIFLLTSMISTSNKGNSTLRPRVYLSNKGNSNTIFSISWQR